jgi:hypothetical protein
VILWFLCWKKACQNFVSAPWESGNPIYQPLDDLHRERLDINWRELTDSIQCDIAFIAALFSERCITLSQKTAIEQEEEPKRGEILLSVIRRKSLAEFRIFLKCLEDTKQDHVLALLAEDAGKCCAAICVFH